MLSKMLDEAEKEEEEEDGEEQGVLRERQMGGCLRSQERWLKSC